MASGAVGRGAVGQDPAELEEKPIGQSFLHRAVVPRAAALLAIVAIRLKEQPPVRLCSRPSVHPPWTCDVPI